jgi:GH25 family lysozyme M1 (1,4-beta-N-acetylmuramidase)
VSHWQGAINWTKVVAAGKQFAIIKATDGRTMNDEMYATNRAGAKAAGLRTTAYHYARPDLSAGDALAEADHFVTVAKLGSGDLIPALDLEEHGGLTVAQLQAWVTTWLDRVAARTGVRPMIYTGPAFWSKYMGGTSTIAAANPTVWVAHWGVSTPSVPASNWAGKGWTFWQTTSSGVVPGISGRVDLDWYRFSGWARVTIP